MNNIHVRSARLDDTAAISALFRARISAWQRWDTLGRVQDTDYETLTIYERWLHGGAWMSIETAALHLGALLLGAGVALVAQVGAEVGAYLEAYHSVEPPPFGSNLSPAHIVVGSAHANIGLDTMLLDALRAKAKTQKCERLTVAALGAESALYTRSGFTTLTSVARYSLPARTGQIFYKASAHSEASAAQINGWSMPVGRISSARQQWEALWPHTWELLPEMRRTYRLKFSAAGGEAFIACQPQMFNPRALDVSVWTQKTLTAQLLTAIRDWAHKEGFRTLLLVVPPEYVSVLGAEAEADGYKLDFYSLNL
ncbi:MAG: hypothetical protein HXY40_07960 [Chloroflexi bacterium]|nr:hypothetical protein [Chloroflexota bacterium]